jgi:hypothetical protein
MGTVKGLVAVVVVALAGVSCGDAIRQGRSPVYLVIDSLTGARGGGAQTFTSPLLSDVYTKNSIFNDLGLVMLRIMPKNLGLDGAIVPSPHNAVTITRYRVTYRRADGRNVPGVDVPYAFDGASTGTVPPTSSLELPFELVRHAAKLESPLIELRCLASQNPQNPCTRRIITTIAEVTFYGRDQVGNAISVTGQIQVDFGDFADED